MTEQEVYEKSTEEERFALRQYQRLQREAKENGGMMGETALLEASQAIGVLVARNKRLGLVK
jgi:hypothetical protein